MEGGAVTDVSGELTYPKKEQVGVNETREQRHARMLRDDERSRAYFAECDRRAWEEVRNRPADWACPDGQPYASPGPIWAEHPCSKWCIEGACRGAAHRVSGTWTPDEHSNAWHFTPLGRPGESEEHRIKRREISLPAFMRRARRDHELLTRWASDKGKPVASVYCQAQGEDGGRCNRRVADLYLVDRTYIVSGEHFTTPEGRANHLNAALAAREAGDDGWADACEAAANVTVWPLVLTLNPRPKGDPLGDWLLVGCRHHGNVMVSTAWLRKVAKGRRHAAVDAQARRFYVLQSEMPPAEG